MRKRAKASFVLFMLTAASGAAMAHNAFAAFGWGMALFIPVAIFTAIEKEGQLLPLAATLAGLAISYMAGGTEVLLNIVEMVVPGYLAWFSIRKNIKGERLTLLFTLYFYLISIGEDLFFGPPSDIEPLKPIIPFRWGLYFFTSALFAVIIMGTISLIAKKDINFKKINFGALPVIFFILSGILSILKWFPLIQIIGANALIATCGFFLIQGFSVTAGVLEKWRPASRIIAFVLAIFFPLAALVIISLAGLFDFWFDFRKLKGGIQ
ncbi:hypothetical protein [Desulfurobacterium sp.]